MSLAKHNGFLPLDRLTCPRCSDDDLALSDESVSLANAQKFAGPGIKFSFRIKGRWKRQYRCSKDFETGDEESGLCEHHLEVGDQINDGLGLEFDFTTIYKSVRTGDYTACFSLECGLGFIRNHVSLLEDSAPDPAEGNLHITAIDNTACDGFDPDNHDDSYDLTARITPVLGIVGSDAGESDADMILCRDVRKFRLGFRLGIPYLVNLYDGSDEVTAHFSQWQVFIYTGDEAAWGDSLNCALLTVPDLFHEVTSGDAGTILGVPVKWKLCYAGSQTTFAGGTDCPGGYTSILGVQNTVEIDILSVNDA